MTDLKGFAKQCGKFATVATPMLAKATKASAVEVEKAVQTSWRAGGYGSMRLRNMGKSGAPLQVRSNVRTTLANATAVVYANPPAYLVEFGSYHQPNGYAEVPKAQQRLAKAQGRRLVKMLAGGKAGAAPRLTSGARAILTPQGPRAAVHHPAIKGKPLFKAGAAAGQQAAKQAYAAELASTMARTFVP